MAYYEDRESGSGIGPLAAALGLGLGAVFAGGRSGLLRPSARLYNKKYMEPLLKGFRTEVRETIPDLKYVLAPYGRYDSYIMDKKHIPKVHKMLMGELTSPSRPALDPSDPLRQSGRDFQPDLEAARGLMDNIASYPIPIRSAEIAGAVDPRAPGAIFFDPTRIDMSESDSVLPEVMRQMIHSFGDRKFRGSSGRELLGGPLAQMLDPQIKRQTQRSIGDMPWWKNEGLLDEQVFASAIREGMQGGRARRMRRAVLENDSVEFERLMEELSQELGGRRNAASLLEWLRRFYGGSRRDEMYDLADAARLSDMAEARGPGFNRFAKRSNRRQPQGAGRVRSVM